MTHVISLGVVRQHKVFVDDPECQMSAVEAIDRAYDVITDPDGEFELDEDVPISKRDVVMEGYVTALSD